jgi:hypothetical protein
MSATLEEPKTQKATTKFIQISSGQPFGQGLTLFALDEAGDVWQIIPGREPNEWTRLPRKRAGGPGRPASR